MGAALGILLALILAAITISVRATMKRAPHGLKQHALIVELTLAHRRAHVGEGIFAAINVLIGISTWWEHGNFAWLLGTAMFAALLLSLLFGVVPEENIETVDITTASSVIWSYFAMWANLRIVAALSGLIFFIMASKAWI